MEKRTWGLASSIFLGSFAVSMTPAFACDGVPCLPTTCLADYYAHVSNGSIAPVGVPTVRSTITGNLVPVVGPQLPGVRVSVGPSAFGGAGVLGGGALGGSGGGGASTTFNSRNINLMSQLTLAQLGGGAGASLYGWVDPTTQHEYAIMGRSNGTSFVDITNPSNPVLVANLPKIAGTPDELWREPKVYGNYVYVGVDRQSATPVGMQIMDLTKLRSYHGGPALTLAADSVYNGVTRIHTLAINKDSGFLYLEGTNLNSGAPHILDVRNPATPVVAGNIPGGTGWDGYSHEAQVVTYHGPDPTYQGREIMLSSNGKQAGTDTFSIIDVTNKTAPARLSSKTYAGAGYIHQGWLTEDQRYFFQNDELDEQSGTTGGHTRTHLWDVSDLDNPVYRGFFDNTTTSIDHNLYVKGNYVYETNYTTGLRILKIGDLTSTNSANWLTEVGFFDTYAANDGATFNGAWNNYPYFPSGNIPISDIDGGLFVVRPTFIPDNSGLPFPPKLPLGGNGELVPEPGSLALLSLVALSSLGRRRRD